MKMLKLKYVLSIFAFLSFLVIGGNINLAKANIAPTVDAGIDITISINDVATTTLYGSVSDPDNTGFLKCAWENNLQQLTALMDVIAPAGICPVELSTLANPGAGNYTLILYGLDGTVVAEDSMTLTLVDSTTGPIANAGVDITITTDEIATTILPGNIANPYNTNPLSCAWYENGIMQLTAIFAVGPNGECPLDLSQSLQPFVQTGSYTLVLYGIDGSVIYSDSMILTIIPPFNNPATVDAGADLVITTDQIVTTLIYGNITDPDNTGFLKCAWEDQNGQQLTMIKDVVNNTCDLDLGMVGSQYFGVGQYVLTLYALDGSFISSDFMTLTIVPANLAPVADAGATTTNTSCAMSCEITLDGSQSTDPDDAIVLFEWFENSILIATGITAPVILDLGFHDITLRVTDSAGATGEVMITVVIDPAALSFEAIDKVYVKKDGKVKISGRVAVPAGLTHFNIGSVGRIIIDIPSLGVVPEIDASVDFVEKSNGNKWKYRANTVYGVSKFSIDWNGAKFNYPNGPLISTGHIGETETELTITSCSLVSVDINGTIINIDANDNVSSSNAGVKIDGDDDGDSDDDDSDGGNSSDDDDDCTVNVRLPFALTSDMVITIDDGVTVTSVLVADYYSVAVGKFTIHGRFDASAVDFSTLDPALVVTMELGFNGYGATLALDNQTWTKIKPKYWQYKH